MRPLLIVDAANVVGSVPDGWWRDRAAAARRLRAALAPMVSGGASDAASRPGREVVMVVEGEAREVAEDLLALDDPAGAVRVVAAPGSGDDAILDLVRAQAPHRPVVVVTADRALRAAVSQAGATLLGPRALPYRRQPPGRLQ